MKASVMGGNSGSDSGDQSGDFENFYTAHFGDTVAMTYGFTADLGEAQDIAQEAFCRAWLRWRDVSTYDNPVAWVRRVATNLAHSRWRRLKTAAAYLVRERPEEYTPAIEPDHVAVVTALRKLPPDQRKAVVLHHLVDLPVAEVAEQLEVPVGTVKSWLHRARAALADDLRMDVRGAVHTPPAQAVVKLAKRHQRVRAAGVAIALIVAILGAYFAVQLIRNDAQPLPPTETPQPSPVSTSDPMREISWTTAVIGFGAPPQGCPSGSVPFTTDKEGEAQGPRTGWPRANFRPAEVSIGDLTGDGRAEAVLVFTCMPDENADDMSNHVLVVQRHEDGSLRALSWTGRPDSIVRSTWVADGVLYVDSRPHPSSQTWEYRLGEVDGWRWNGGLFAPEIISSRYPGTRALDVRPVAAKLPCAKAQMTLDDESLSLSAYSQIWAELGRPGRPYLLLVVECSPSSRTLVIFDRDGGTWRALDAVPGGDLVDMHADKVTVTNANSTTTYSWNGKTFSPQ